MVNLSFNELIIISPHCDDDLIGNYEIISTKSYKPIIIYTEKTNTQRKEESLKLKDFFPNIKAQLFEKSIPSHFINKDNLFLFPDPIYEFHPAHRLQSCIGEKMFHENYNVVFYNINMTAPYCHEVKCFKDKERYLNLIYPSQKSLWEHDKKWVLFEGRNKWLNNICLG